MASVFKKRSMRAPTMWIEPGTGGWGLTLSPNSVQSTNVVSQVVLVNAFAAVGGVPSIQRMRVETVRGQVNWTVSVAALAAFSWSWGITVANLSGATLESPDPANSLNADRRWLWLWHGGWQQGGGSFNTLNTGLEEMVNAFVNVKSKVLLHPNQALVLQQSFNSNAAAQTTPLTYGVHLRTLISKVA